MRQLARGRPRLVAVEPARLPRMGDRLVRHARHQVDGERVLMSEEVEALGVVFPVRGDQEASRDLR